eukprot:g12021.t1
MLIRDDHCDLAGEGLHEVVFTPLANAGLLLHPMTEAFATPRGETEVVSPWQSGGFGKLPEPRLRKRWALWFALFPRLSWVVSVDSLLCCWSWRVGILGGTTFPSGCVLPESLRWWGFMGRWNFSVSLHIRWHDFPFWLCLARVVALVGLYGKQMLTESILTLHLDYNYFYLILSYFNNNDTKATDWKTKNQQGLKTARADRYDLPLRVLRGLTSCLTQVRKTFFAETAASAGKVPSLQQANRFSMQSPVHNFMTEMQISQDGGNEKQTKTVTSTRITRFACFLSIRLCFPILFVSTTS